MDTNPFKEKLETELKQLETELASVGRLDPDNKIDWVPRKDEDNIDTADRDAVADSLESLDENTAILTDLEIRHSEILSALQRIENGSFGICTTCGKPIETDRLGANPAATTCKQDMK
jgi:RNA polymerase-binding transcription factor DksA